VPGHTKHQSEDNDTKKSTSYSYQQDEENFLSSCSREENDSKILSDLETFKG
jgi:hypothetical protein